MTGRERIDAAMRMQPVDRVPLMCQPSWGFILLNTPELDPIDLWHNHDGAYAKAFCDISERFGFDGVMLPGVGLAPLDMNRVARIDRDHAEGPLVTFNNGDSCLYCRNDLPRYSYAKTPEQDPNTFDPETICESLSYHPPSNHLRMWLNDDKVGRVAELTQSRAMIGPGHSVHGAIYCPMDYLIDLFGAENALIALLTDPDTCSDILHRYALALIGHVREQIDAGADALNYSAPWSGQGFISRPMYETIIAPAQKLIVDVCKELNVPCYCHTCGAIDDRLELIMDVGFDGIECLDPPPLGNVELDDAFKRIGNRGFIKGNIDPVHTLMNGSTDQIKRDVCRRLEIGMQHGNFILSSACAIAPTTPPQNLALLRKLVDQYGFY